MSINASSAFELNGRTLKESVKQVIEAGLVPFIKGQPGV